MLEFLKIVLGGVVGSALSAAAVIATGAFGYLNKDRELDIEMVRVSLSILAGENKDTSEPGRRFALNALEQYSGVDIPDGDFENWVKRGTVPQELILGNASADSSFGKAAAAAYVMQWLQKSKKAHQDDLERPQLGRDPLPNWD